MTRIDPDSARPDPEPPERRRRGSYLTGSRAEAIEASVRRLEDRVEAELARGDERLNRMLGLTTELTRLVTAAINRTPRRGG